MIYFFLILCVQSIYMNDLLSPQNTFSRWGGKAVNLEKKYYYIDFLLDLKHKEINVLLAVSNRIYSDCRGQCERGSCNRIVPVETKPWFGKL